MTKVPQISPTDAIKAYQDGVPIVDVREQSEVDAFKIPETRHAEMSESIAFVQSQWPDKGAKIIVQCHSGARSNHVADHLMNLGYTDVHNLAGGIIGWAKSGGPVVEGS